MRDSAAFSNRDIHSLLPYPSHCELVLIAKLIPKAEMQGVAAISAASNSAAFLNRDIHPFSTSGECHTRYSGAAVAMIQRSSNFSLVDPLAVLESSYLLIMFCISIAG